MRNGVAPLILAAVAVFSSGANCARVCGNGTSPSAGSFQYRLVDVRYDGPDPSKELGVSTIAVGLGTASGTPLYECVAQWPESWAGWYEGGNSAIWSDCIWTGAGFGQDKTVSFAVDWRNKTLYVAHSFDCSDKLGSDGLASGSIALDFDCSSRDGLVYCIPKSTSTGARADLRINTSLGPAAPKEAASCSSSPSSRQSWRIENWLRRYQMAPGSTSPWSPKPLQSDTGPSFTLRSRPSNATFSCATTEQRNGTFSGTCKPSGTETSATGAANFSFDSRLNILKVSQQQDCNGRLLSAVGIAYFQAICDRGFNSIVFTCTSPPLWIGEGIA